MDYKDKYLKYKSKYVNLKNRLTQSGGSDNKSTIYLFKAEWCGHCKNFKSTWDALKNKYANQYNFITYDADKNSKEIKQWNIEGFPTIFKQTGNKAVEYVGSRDVDSMVNFLEN
jgi:thiol-disulfide isomerase/thioredoxin